MLTYIKESIEELKNNVTLPSRAESSNLDGNRCCFFHFVRAWHTWGVDYYFQST